MIIIFKGKEYDTEKEEVEEEVPRIMGATGNMIGFCQSLSGFYYVTGCSNTYQNPKSNLTPINPKSNLTPIIEVKKKNILRKILFKIKEFFIKSWNNLIRKN
jgi:hypothetical protein